jgi:hypothetical protein
MRCATVPDADVSFDRERLVLAVELLAREGSPTDD